MNYLSKTIFNESYRLGDMKENPLLSVKYLTRDTKVKITLTDNEVQKLFNKKSQISGKLKPAT